MDFDESHPFYGSTFAFTGTLTSMTRKEAMQKVVDVGGACADTLNKYVNFLVIGIQDFQRFRDGKKSSKMRKAEEYISGGQKLEIIDENDFIKML
jgi:DNA polymerase-3 subunit epsilon